MFKTPFAVLVALPLLAASVAFAEPAAAPQHQDGDHAAWHKKVCGEVYAHRAGGLAYLEAKLALTSQQRPAWTKWQQAQLDAAAKERSSCLEATPKAEGQHSTALEHEARIEKVLTAKLQELQASRPALQALYEELTPEQKAVFDHNACHHRHGHGGMHGHSDWHHGGKAG